MSSERIDNALQLLRAEYLDTPDLLLTPGEAAELLDVDRTTALALLEALEDSGFLVLTSDGGSADRKTGGEQPPVRRGPGDAEPSSDLLPHGQRGRRKRANRAQIADLAGKRPSPGF